MFKVNDRVVSEFYGEGIVTSLAADSRFPLLVKFGNGVYSNYQHFTLEGWYWYTSTKDTGRNIAPLEAPQKPCEPRCVYCSSIDVYQKADAVWSPEASKMVLDESSLDYWYCNVCKDQTEISTDALRKIDVVFNASSITHYQLKQQYTVPSSWSEDKVQKFLEEEAEAQDGGDFCSNGLGEWQREDTNYTEAEV